MSLTMEPRPDPTKCGHKGKGFYFMTWLVWCIDCGAHFRPGTRARRGELWNG